jgi:hypothetical protein
LDASTFLKPPWIKFENFTHLFKDEKKNSTPHVDDKYKKVFIVMNKEIRRKIMM